MYSTHGGVALGGVALGSGALSSDITLGGGVVRDQLHVYLPEALEVFHTT